MWLLGVSDEELGPISVGTTVGHGNNASCVVLWKGSIKHGTADGRTIANLQSLVKSVFKFLAPDAGPSFTSTYNEWVSR